MHCFLRRNSRKIFFTGVQILVSSQYIMKYVTQAIPAHGSLLVDSVILRRSEIGCFLIEVFLKDHGGVKEL